MCAGGVDIAWGGYGEGISGFFIYSMGLDYGRGRIFYFHGGDTGLAVVYYVACGGGGASHSF